MEAVLPGGVVVELITVAEPGDAPDVLRVRVDDARQLDGGLALDVHLLGAVDLRLLHCWWRVRY